MQTVGFLLMHRVPGTLIYHILTYLLVRFVQTNSSVEGYNDAWVETEVGISMINKNGVWVALNPDL
jgi:hypothetical protein